MGSFKEVQSRETNVIADKTQIKAAHIGREEVSLKLRKTVNADNNEIIYI